MQLYNMVAETVTLNVSHQCVWLLLMVPDPAWLNLAVPSALQQIQPSEHCSLHRGESASPAPLHPAGAHGWWGPQVLPQGDAPSPSE